jgi:hypothetical protein
LDFQWLHVAVPIYFFFVGLADGFYHFKKYGPVGIILLIVAAVLMGTLWLKGHDHLGLAK